MKDVRSIDTSRYSLQAIATLNSQTTAKERYGCLLRICFKDGTIGYADCHPWVELQDLPLEEQLKHLTHDSLTALTARSLDFAKIDAAARKEKRNLFGSLALPASHVLIPDIFLCHSPTLEDYFLRGFTHVKIKMGRDWEKELVRLKEFFQLPFRFKVRLDFNSSLSVKQLEIFLSEIEPWKDSLDYIEDPFAFDAKQWKSIQQTFDCSLACDYHSEQAIGNHEAASVLIVKPAVQSADSFSQAKTQRLVFTSYLDHPLGQLGALFCAAQSNSKETGGFLSHTAYQPNPFSQSLRQNGPFLIPPEGFGFGFDALLENLVWLPLRIHAAALG